MYKYYWNDRLVRKSKSRGNYTHAVVRVSKVDGDLYVFGCSSRLDLAQKVLETAIRVNPDYRISQINGGTKMKKSDMIALLEAMSENTNSCAKDMQETQGKTEVNIRMEGQVMGYRTAIALLKDPQFAKEMWNIFMKE